MSLTLSMNHGPGGSVIVNGVVLQGDNFKEYCKRNGKCQLCGVYLTHVKRSRGIFDLLSSPEPITQKNANGEYEVYKGFCIQPTCYTLDQAKQILGETKPRREKKPSSRKKGREVDSGRDERIVDVLPVHPNTTKSSVPQRTLIFPEGTSPGCHPVSEASSSATPYSIDCEGPSIGLYVLPTVVGNNSSYSQSKPYPFRRIPLEPHESSLHLLNSSSASSDEVTPETSVIQQLQESACDQDFNSFFSTFDLNSAKPKVSMKGLQILREMVLAAHERNPDRNVFPRDTWVKILKSAMSANASDSEIQMQSILTFWFLCALSRRYMADVTRYKGVHDILTTMDKFKNVNSIRTSCCGALECLSRYEADGIQLQSEIGERTIRNIVSLLDDPCSCRKDWAIRALYNLSCQARTASGCYALGIQIRDSISHGRRFETLFTDVWEEFCHKHDMEYLMWLLWRLSAQPADTCGKSVLLPSNELLEAIAAAMNLSESQIVHEAALGLLCNLALRHDDSVEEEMSMAWTTIVPNAVLGTLEKHEDRETLQVAGLHTLCNMLGNSHTRLGFPCVNTAIGFVIKSLNKFTSNPDIQLLNCHALAYLASRDDVSKATIINCGGIESLVNAHHIQMNPSEKDLQTKGAVRTEPFYALAHLASVSDAPLQILNSALLVIRLEDSNGKSFLHKIFGCIIPRLKAAPGPDIDRAYDTLVNTILNIVLEQPSVEYAESMIATLNTMISDFPKALDSIMKATDGSGFYRLLQTIRVYSDSSVIQANGFEILAKFYAKESFQGRIVQTYQVDAVSTSLNVQTRTAEEVNLAREALRKHRSDPLVAEQVLAALCNFTVRANISETDSDTRWYLADEIMALFSGCFEEAVNTLTIHETNSGVQRNALRFVYALTFITAELEIRQWSLQVIDKVSVTMIHYPDDSDIHQCGCNILAHLSDLPDDENTAADIGGANCLGALVRSLQLENEDIVTDSLQIIAMRLNRVFTAAGQFLENAEYIYLVMGCMYRYQQSAIIQATACSILASLSALNDHSAKQTIAQCGGVFSVVQAMEQYRDEPFVQVHAYKALAGLAAGISRSVMLSIRSDIGSEILFTLRNHHDDETVQCALLETCWELCKKDEYYTALFSNSNDIAQIIDSMTRHLASVDVQTAGCSLLLVLAMYGDNNRIIGEVGGIRAINLAMLAHIKFTALQKEAMNALKNISTISSNKVHLCQHRADETVMLVMWAHADSPSVLCLSLSALNNIAVDFETKQVSAVPDKILQCVLTIMRIHPWSLPLQMNACFLLKSYSFCESMVTLMKTRCDEIMELLTMAAESFPGECSERATCVLQKL